MANIYGEKSNLKVQWEKVRNAPLQERFDWFLHYFGLYAAIGLGILALVIALIITISKSKTPYVLNGTFLGTTFEEDEIAAMKTALCKDLNYEEKKYNIGLTAYLSGAEGTEYQMYQLEAIYAQVAGKTLDVVGSTEKGIQGYVDPENVSGSIFINLESVLPDDLLSDLIAADRIRCVETADGEQLPFFIVIGNSRISDLLNIVIPDYCIGVTVTAPHKDTVLALARMALQPAE